MTATDFDAIIVGSGPGGSTAADLLTAAGKSVVIFEKGRNHLIDAADPRRLATDYSNDEIKFLCRHFLGPDPLLEPRTFRTGPGDGERSHVGEVNNVPSTVGGGGVHADGKVPRFREDDFKMLSEWGPVEGASIADWPLAYEDLEPSYAEAERLIGVAGLAGANPFAAPRSGPYPMPPGAPMYSALLTSAAAEKLGWHPYPAPTAVNSVPYDGRPACNNCGFCAFFGCPIHAKGDPVASLQRAMLTGRAELRAETFVSRIVTRNNKATGVEYIGPDGTTRSESAPLVILAAGGLETPRLMLLSGFDHPLIGRNVMFHLQTYVVGEVPMRVHGHKGRSVTHVHDDFIVPDAESLSAARGSGLKWFKGGMVEHASPGHPVQEAKHLPWGPMHKKAMRRSRTREHMLAFCMQGEDLPQESNRVDLDPAVRDVRGFPAMRVTYRPHRHEVAASAFYGAKLEECLRLVGAEWTMSFAAPGPQQPVPISRHVAGTARMGDDPATSVCDRWGRVHAVPNVVIADSSLFPTGAGYGPTLTLVALAVRNIGALAGL